MPLLPRTLLLLDEPYREAKGTYYCPFNWWRFAEKLAAHCESATLYVPLAQDSSPPGLPVAELKRLRVVGRPYYERLQQYYANLPRTWRALRQQACQLVTQHDLVIIRGPAPAAKSLVRAAARRRKPLAMLVAGDVREQSAWVANQRGPAAWVGRLLTHLVRRQEHAFARRCVFVGVWGQDLRRVFGADCPRVEICQDPNIEAAQLSWREDTCQKAPTRLIRVCRLLPSKGLEFLLEAVARLNQEGCTVALEIAGAGDDPNYVGSLRSLASELGLADHVVFHGSVPFGPRLFELFRASDIHVISSLAEGLPRIVAEGRAFCLPTVATRVGGIPSVVRDGVDGLLVPPGDSSALATAISRIISDGDLRRRIIARSFEIAKQSTAEHHAERLARLIAGAIAREQ